ncbi:MAG: ABC transporter substrate-binding protein [Pyrinomonadaceae bacterium]
MRKNRKNCIALGCLLLAIGCWLGGCQSENSNIQIPALATRQVTDDLGRRVKIPEKVERAVSLAPNLTEIIFAVDAGGKLVGDTTYCDYPAAAQKIQKIGDTLNPNIEAIIALKPQVVFVSTASQIETFTRTLEQQNIAVFITNPKNLDGVYQSIFQIGEILDRSEKANEIVGEMKRRASDVKEQTRASNRVKTFVQISREPLFTIGKDSFITDLIERAGGASVTANVPEAYPKFSKETALALQPEAIILSDSPDDLEPNDVFKNSPAVKNGRVFKISADLLSRPSPRIIDALEQIARDLHPESFR